PYATESSVSWSAASPWRTSAAATWACSPPASLAPWRAGLPSSTGSRRLVERQASLGLGRVEHRQCAGHVRRLHVAEPGGDVDDSVGAVAESSTTTRRSAGTRGTGSVLVARITTCSCRTWLCSTSPAWSGARSPCPG